MMENTLSRTKAKQEVIEALPDAKVIGVGLSMIPLAIGLWAIASLFVAMVMAGGPLELAMTFIALF